MLLIFDPKRISQLTITNNFNMRNTLLFFVFPFFYKMYLTLFLPLLCPPDSVISPATCCDNCMLHVW